MEDGASREKKEISVLVKSGAQTLTVSLPSDAPVKDLMARLQQLTNILPRGQKLIHKGAVFCFALLAHTVCCNYLSRVKASGQMFAPRVHSVTCTLCCKHQLLNRHLFL